VPAALQVCLLALLAAAIAGCGDPSWTARKPASGQASLSGYAGREACAECHAGIAETFSRTGMGRAFYPIGEGGVAGDFTRDNRLELPDDRLLYEMTARDGRYFMRQSVLDEDGRPLASLEKEILYVLGSGNHSRSYLAAESDSYFELPVCWYPDKPGWDLCPGFEQFNFFFNRRLDDSCLFCHNALMRETVEGSNRSPDPPPHGIDCERCHGPGSRHVEKWRNPPEEDAGGPDDTIVNPAKLPRSTRMDVCMQCHLGDSEATERVLRPGMALERFRPGERIDAYIDVLTIEPARVNRFGLSSQVDRLMLSRCFKESGGGIDCLTCHNPHVSVYDPGRPEGRFRDACLTCHQTTSCNLPEESRRARVASDDCTVCHMRKTDPADQKHTRFTDHWIRRAIDPPGPPEPAEGAFTLRRVLDRGALPPGEAALDEGTAYLEKRAGSPYGKSVAPSLVEEKLRAAVEENPGLALAWHQLGRAATQRGDASAAIGAYRQALDLNPGLRSARRGLATALLAMGRAREASELLDLLLKYDPTDVAAMNDKGRVQVILGDLDAAAATFAGALALAKDDPRVLANAGLLEAKRGDHGGAAAYLRQAGAAEPTSAEIWTALASELLAASKPAEALGPARHAAFIAPRDARARFTLGSALAANGRRGEAAAELRAALEIRPGYADAKRALDRLEPPRRGAGK